MKAVVITSPGGPQVLQVEEVENPRIGDDEVLIKIGATTLNWADTVQRKGLYPLPEGASPYPGLECAGTVESVGKNVTRWTVGDEWRRICGESSCSGQTSSSSSTRYFFDRSCKFSRGGLYSVVDCLYDERTVCRGNFPGSQEKLTFCKELGADVCINYKTEDFVVCVKEETRGKGVDVILDNVVGPYFQRNLNSLNVNGRLFIIGFQGGTITEANLGCMLARRLTVQAEAHSLMESSKHIGKILLIP